MKTVGISEVRRQFSRLLDEVAQGEEVIITRRGVPVARLRQVQPKQPKRDLEAALRELDEFREAHPLRGLRIKDLIEEGRRY